MFSGGFFYVSVGVYLSLNDDIIPNHGYVVISDIGSTDDTALICHTNRPPPDNAANSGGNWFVPDNTRVITDGVPGFRRNRGPMIVRLLRNTATDPPSEGIYQCLIMAAGETAVTAVHVGLYNSGGGTHRRLYIHSSFVLFLLNFCRKTVIMHKTIVHHTWAWSEIGLIHILHSPHIQMTFTLND